MILARFQRRLNPFERIQATEGKVFLLLLGLAILCVVFELTASPQPSYAWRLMQVVAILIYIAVGTYGTMRIVARPVRRAKAHFDAIASGDYTRPVRTRRTDEFGDMLRALDQMRGSLAAAVAARDAAEHRYREIVERSLQGFYQSTEDGNLLAANDALARLLGYDSVASMLAQPAGLSKRLHADPARRAKFVDLMRADGGAKSFEAPLRRRDGTIVWVSETARVVHDDTHGVRFEGFLDDISDRKAAEQLKSDFVSFVTHQLRTPLSGIRWMLELAAEAESADEVQSFIADGHASAQRLITLVNDLLDVTRLEAGRLTTTPTLEDVQTLATALKGELEPLARARSQTLTVSGTAGPVLADRQLLRQAILNLMANAIKYTPDGGRVEVLVEVTASEVQLHVRDTGIGIPEGAQPRLFQKFYRADNAHVIDTEGSGLGLYLVRLIAEHSQGRVTCRSIEGEGSTFTLSLPLASVQKAVA